MGSRKDSGRGDKGGQDEEETRERREGEMRRGRDEERRRWGEEEMGRGGDGERRREYKLSGGKRARKGLK